jgi:hypothetical protein
MCMIGIGAIVEAKLPDRSIFLLPVYGEAD